MMVQHETMTASFVVGPNKIITGSAPRPEAGDGILLRVLYCGVCGSDRRQVASISPGARKIIGHEVVGEVIEAGEGLEKWEGRRVGVAPRIGCGSCSSCSRGLPNLCPNRRTVGYELPGGFSQFLSLPRDSVARGNVIEIPGCLDPKVAALAEPLSCVLNGIGLSGLHGGSLLILGAGPMGQLFTMAARGNVERLYVVEPDRERRDFTSKHGADGVFAPNSADIPQAETTVVACSSPAAYRLALEKAPPGGTINLFGGLEKGLPIDSNQIHYRQLRVHGTSGSTPEQFERALEVLAADQAFADIITDVISFDGLPEALAPASSEKGLSLKWVLDPWRD